MLFGISWQMIRLSGSGVRHLPENVRFTDAQSLSIGCPLWMTKIIELIQYV